MKDSLGVKWMAAPVTLGTISTRKAPEKIKLTDLLEIRRPLHQRTDPQTLPRLFFAKQILFRNPLWPVYDSSQNDCYEWDSFLCSLKCVFVYHSGKVLLIATWIYSEVF